jgi:hypothetical protein
MNSVLSNVGRCVLVGSLALMVGCSEKAWVGTSPPIDTLSLGFESVFPDSVTRSMGLPPFVQIPSSGGVLFDPHAPGDFSGLTAHASSTITDVAPRMLRTTMWLLNHGPQATSVLYGECDNDAQLQVSGRVAWQWGKAKDPRDPSTYGRICSAVGYLQTILPGDSARFDNAIPMYEVLGDTLRDGVYDVRVSQKVAPYPFTGMAGERVFDAPAGQLSIVRVPDRLPLERTVDSMTYVATTRRVKDDAGNDVLRALVLVTNHASTIRYGTYYSSCPINLEAYRSRAERDSVPNVPSAAFLRPPCDNYAHSFALAPGQSWVFGNDFPVTTLNGTAGTGQYWFTASFGNLRLSANHADTR